MKMILFHHIFSVSADCKQNEGSNAPPPQNFNNHHKNDFEI